MNYEVAIDAGHGKNTPGKRSPDNTYFEYEFNHDVAKKIKLHLERCGISVILTSPNPDIDSSLSSRCKLANNSNVKCVVSIHTNAAGDGWSSANYWVAFVIAKGGNAERLGKLIEEESIPYLGLKSNGIQTQNLAMVRDTKAPAVLVEHGFHTNKEFLPKLKSQEYRNMCALADAKAICRFLNKSWVEPSNTSEPEMWYDEYMDWAKKNDIMDGTRPNEFVTRAECVKMIKKCIENGVM